MKGDDDERVDEDDGQDLRDVLKIPKPSKIPQKRERLPSAETLEGKLRKMRQDMQDLMTEGLSQIYVDGCAKFSDDRSVILDESLDEEERNHYRYQALRMHHHRLDGIIKVRESFKVLDEAFRVINSDLSHL